MFKIIDCSQRIEANWNWNTTTFISQAYKNKDQFQEFGLKWFGRGFTHITTPKWIDLNLKNLKIYFDPEFELTKQFKLRGVPTTILLNKEGNEFARIIGDINFEDEKFIEWINNFM